MSDMLQIAISI